MAHLKNAKYNPEGSVMKRIPKLVNKDLKDGQIMENYIKNSFLSGSTADKLKDKVKQNREKNKLPINTAAKMVLEKQKLKDATSTNALNLLGG